MDNKLKYDKRFDEIQVELLAEKGITPELANKYDKRFDYKEIVLLSDNHVSPEVANKSGERFTNMEIFTLLNMKVSPEVANKYDKKFEALDIAWYLENKIYPEVANKYDERFTNMDIFGLTEMKVSPEVANKYNKRFNSLDVRCMTILPEYKVSPEVANKYEKRFEGEQILFLNMMEITPEVFSSFEDNKKEKMYNMSNKIVDYLCKLSDKNDVHWIYKNYSFFNTGNTAIIMFDKERKSVWKFSPNINEEARLLKKLNNPEYVVKIKGEPQEDIAIELEYIKGNSLEKMIEEQKLSNTRVLKYSSGIMKGLVEMRKAGIYYHRDIRPANVLIDEEKDRAVICDLGIATEDKGAKPLENKRYGPAGDKANDLFSLGLLTYKMATGSHLFADSPEMERNVDRVYNEIKNADNDPYLFNDYITKVEKNVSNDSSGKKIKSVIKACLTAQNNEHEKMQEMFKEYTK